MAEKMNYFSDGFAGKTLRFFWIVDCSGSMSGEMIETVNRSISAVVPAMEAAVAQVPGARLLIQTLQFSDGASWVDAPVPVEEFEWKGLQAGGVTDMGAAFELLAAQLTSPPMPERGTPPVLVLVSDGYPTDAYETSLNKLLQQPWGKKAVRFAISIGPDADNAVLTEFAGGRECVLQADNAETLSRMIEWTAKTVSMVLEPVGIPHPDDIVIGDISQYTGTCKRFLDSDMPEEIRENYQKLIERVTVLQDSMVKYGDIYRPDIDQLNEYFMPEALRVTAAYLNYKAEGASEAILAETEASVYQATKKLLQVVNEKIDEIYRFVLIETTAKAKAVEAMMCQDGYVDAEYKI